MKIDLWWILYKMIRANILLFRVFDKKNFSFTPLISPCTVSGYYVLIWFNNATQLNQSRYKWWILFMMTDNLSKYVENI